MEAVGVSGCIVGYFECILLLASGLVVRPKNPFANPSQIRFLGLANGFLVHLPDMDRKWLFAASIQLRSVAVHRDPFCLRHAIFGIHPSHQTNPRPLFVSI